MNSSIHKGVLLKESIKFLNVSEGIYIDCTLGGGGHTKEIVKSLEKGKVICIDSDQEAIEKFRDYLEKKDWKKKDEAYVKGKVEIILENSNFDNLSKIADRLKIKSAQGIIADLGMSSDQIEDSQRGFSYMKDGPLDMRYDKDLKVKASDLVNGLYESELVKLIKGQDEWYAKRIAQGIVKERKLKPIKTTSHLVQIIRKALPRKKGRSYSNRPYVGAYWRKPVMRVFQALRIAVNSELSSLQILLPQALDLLSSGVSPAQRQGNEKVCGRFVIISFHSGEDRIVKKFFIENREKIEVLTKKPVRPSRDEIEENQRARSAKLRAYQKL